MDSIELGGLTFYGYHGALDEERRLGQRFVVGLRLALDLGPAGRSDDLARTVNYAAVAETVRQVVEGRPFRLIEALAEAIASAVLAAYRPVAGVEVRVEKPGAPVAAVPTAQVAVAISRQREDRTADLAGEPREAPAGSVLAASGIRALLASEPPLLSPVDDLAAQLQPNGFDLTLEGVWRLEGAGVLGVSNAERVLPGRMPVAPDAAGQLDLGPGTYLVRFRESVALPLDLMAFGRPRSSLLRSGAALHTAVWDAGYHGRSESLLVVYAEAGIRLAVGARLLQLVFVRLEGSTYGYSGVYQRENLPPTT